MAPIELELAALHCAQTIARPDPLEAPLLSAFTRVWGTGSGSDAGQMELGDAIIYIAEYVRDPVGRIESVRELDGTVRISATPKFQPLITV